MPARRETGAGDMTALSLLAQLGASFLIAALLFASCLYIGNHPPR